jgi:hypothetical protein
MLFQIPQRILQKFSYRPVKKLLYVTGNKRNPSKPVFLNRRASRSRLPNRELILKIHKVSTIEHQEETNLFKKENILTIIII